MKAQDCIIKTPFQPHKPHSDILAMGYRFLCAHISIEALVQQDVFLQTNSHEVVAVEQEQGWNFYTKD